MTRTAFYYMCIIGWIGIIILIPVTGNAQIMRIGVAYGVSTAVVYVGVYALIVVGMVLNTILADSLFPQMEIVDETGLSADQRRERALRQAKLHLDNGEYKLAIVAYESGGLLDKALELASKHDDSVALARLYKRRGAIDKACIYLVRTGDFLAAGHLSLKAKLPDKAREYYNRHLDAHESAMKPLEKAAFFDRVGKSRMAFPYYEQSGDYLRAAQSALSSNLQDHYHAMMQKLDMVQAYEKQKGKDTEQSRDQQRRRAHQSLMMLNDEGDLFGAAWAYQSIEEWSKAIEIWKEIGEFARASVCAEILGEKDRAAEFREKAGLKAPELQNSQPSFAPPSATPSHGAFSASPPMAPPPMFPMPGEVPVGHQFVPIGQGSNVVPLYIPVSYGIETEPTKSSAKTPEEIANYLAMQGQLTKAADVYMQAGRVQDAIKLLVEANNRREAAMFALATGDYARAADLMVEVIEAGGDPEIGLLLGEMLIEMNDGELALQLLNNRLAPKITEINSLFVYKYGRAFETAEMWPQAADVYQNLINSGASSKDLEQRLMVVLEKIHSSPARKNRESTHGASTSVLNPQTIKAMGAKDFLDAMFADDDDIDFKEAPKKQPAKTPVAYPFSPIGVTREVAKPGTMTAATTPPDPRHQISLMGSMEATTSTSNEIDTPFEVSHRYDIKRELGRGGMGVVYEATDTLLDRPVALKLLNSFGRGSDELRQFLLEARAIARLNNPHVIAVYDMGIMDLNHYIAMEYVNGADLKALVRKEKQLSTKEALRLFIEIAEGLKAAHHAGIVHRDIKPANVLLTADRSARIVDFGLAKLQQNDETGEQEKTLFRFAGTPGFMAPEQATSGEAGPSADIYALGITLFTMLVGVPPYMFKGIKGHHNILQFQLSGELPTIQEVRPEVPSAIEHLYKYCTSLQETERYQEVDAFLPIAKQWYEVI